ncbi:ROK family protein [Cryptosporangium sp. NPDC051539]|uniref:ROK family transcriptional regulator n=1 Tax=Cryptosporangium sp. NPDC051539 TaxID=3363962 RepID=UPI0037AE6712
MSGSPSALRFLNDRAALEALLQHEAITRAQLEALVGLSKPATAQLLSRLEKAGLVERLGRREVGPGPRAQLWGLKADAGFAAGVDVTRQGIDVEIADLRGNTVAQHLAPAPAGTTSSAATAPGPTPGSGPGPTPGSGPGPTPGSGPGAALGAALAEACAQAGISVDRLAHVAIGTPGSVDAVSGRLRYASDVPAWTNVNVLQAIGAVLDVPFTIENDVNLVALNEMARGSAQDVRDFVLLWISERSVGSSVVVHGGLVRGATLGAGELGFTPVPDLAREPLPGVHRFGDLLANSALLTLAGSHGLQAVGAVDAVRQSLGRDGGFLTDLARRIAAGLAAVVSILDPELIVLGGAVCSTGGPALRAAISDALAEFVEPRVRILPGRPDSDSVRAGAVQAALVHAREHYFSAGSSLGDS